MTDGEDTQTPKHPGKINRGFVLDPEILRQGHSKISKIFQYLRELNHLRYPVKRQIGEQPWTLWFRDLPDHPSVRRGIVRYEKNDGNSPGEPPENASSEDDFILTVVRPKLTQAPSPPALIADWILPGWDKIDGRVENIPSRNEQSALGDTRIVRFEDDPRRPEVFARWKSVRGEWERNERPARRAAELFERLFELHGQLEREAERLELVLGDGILNWRLNEGGVHHPILLQRLQMEFDPNVPEFILREAETPVELYSALFRIIPEIDGRSVRQCQEEIEHGSYHPLEEEFTSGFLRRLAARISGRGEYVGEERIQSEKDYPRVGRDPVIFLRQRTLGFSTAIDAVLQDLQGRKDLPPSLLKISGVDPPVQEEQDEEAPQSGNGNEDHQVLFSKPANKEQLQIAHRLESHKSVLVQGPPGTGKTHTIGNLLGHLMAQGKTVLVTSHTTKALRRVRDHVVDRLRPLCVSVLESDMESRKQLENSVTSIIDQFSSSSVEELEAKAEPLEKQRDQVLIRLSKTRSKLHTTCADEYREVVVAGQGYPPSDAARTVNEGRGRNDWIPGPVKLGNPLPLSRGELIELYATNQSVPLEDERELNLALPNPEDLLPPSELDQLVSAHERLKSEDQGFGQDLWGADPEIQDPEQLENLLGSLLKVAGTLENESGWHIPIIYAGDMGGKLREPWESLMSKVGVAFDEAAGTQEMLLRYGPTLAGDEDIEEQARILMEIIGHLDKGGSLGILTLLMHPSWKRLLVKVNVEGKPPVEKVHFRVLLTAAKLSISRRKLISRWDRQVIAIGGPSLGKNAEYPERIGYQHVGTIKDYLDWHDTTWRPLEAELARHGFLWKDCISSVPPKNSPHGDLLRLRDAAIGPVQQAIAARIKFLRNQHIESVFGKMLGHLEYAGGSVTPATVVYRLREAVSGKDGRSYREAFARLVELQHRRVALDRRMKLLTSLEASAPAWANAIRDRRAPHEGQELPGDPHDAWLWRQFNDELDNRGSVSVETLQQEIERLTDTLQRLTAESIECRAWAAQIRRTELPQQQALMGWMQTIRRIGKGMGKRVPRLQAEARRLMAESRTAVPVWVMPLARVVDNFDPRQARFDVVIIDEASQCDVMGLIALYMSKQVVIVGDHEQVSPDAVGQRVEEVQRLIDAHLQGIPNANLYDGQLSIYDLAMSSFGGIICLREHFRCVPEIIQFSNDLSYNYQVRPLRDTFLAALKPHVVPFRVEGGVSRNKINELEAKTVASLVIAATEQPEYAGKTFGVISLVGEEQAREINRLLIRHMKPDEYKSRHIVCGNAAQFQGDERDIMFLSVVDATENGPLSLREAGARDMFKKRFNVAASRARDQMWVVYSLDPKTDLQERDLRRRLIGHALDPQILMKALEQKESRVESELERQVLRRLVSAGYRVTPQWRVGYYRIDLVVEGGGKKLAIECDGDRYHPLEKLEEDMGRQAILERLGWKFSRIRGSAFFRDPDKAMKHVFIRLQEMEIPPETDATSNGKGKDNSEGLINRIKKDAFNIISDWDQPVDG